ncbi:MAG TPA: ABC transporter substrate-binding protein [Methylobacter sp.]|jgi:ABC-type amino acid transport substrate-binding protein
MRRLSFNIFLLLVFIITGVHADDFGSMPPDIARIKKRGELVVAMHHEDVPLFCMHNSNNELVGIDIEIARDIAEKLGVKLILNRDSITFDEIVQTVASRKADIGLSSLSDTLERATTVSFTTPYWSLKQALLINRLKLSSYKDHPNFKEIELLLNQTGIEIGVLKGSSYVDFAKKIFPLASIVSYPTIAQGIEDTKKAKLLAFLYDEVEIMNWNKLHPEDSLFLKSEFITRSEDTLAIAVHWQDTHLLSWLNLSIQQSKNNFLNELKAKYSEIK